MSRRKDRGAARKDDKDELFMFEDALELSDVVEAFGALLEHGLKKLPSGMARSFERDDYAAALAIARDHYSAITQDEKRGSLREAAMMYVILLTFRGLHEEASNILKKVMARHAQDVRLQLTQAISVMEQGEADVARQLLDGLSELKMADGRLWAFMGHLYLDLEEVDEAIRCYKEALEGGSQDVEVAYRLSRLLWEHDDTREDGALYLERAARLATQDARLWSLAGQAWSELQDWGRAVDAFGRVVKLEEDEEEGWLDYGESLRARGDLEAAARAFERASRLDPLNNVARLELAYTRHMQGFFEEALQEYQRVLKERPGQLEALQGAAMAQFEQGDFEAALRYVEEVLERAPEQAEAHYNRGLILMELGANDALASLEKASELDPEHGGYRLRLLLARLQNGSAGDEAQVVRAAHEAMARGGELGELLEVLGRLIVLRRDAEVSALLEWYEPYAEELEDIDWLLVTPLYRYVLATREEKEDVLEELEQRFDERVDRFAEELPVMIDLEELERLAMKLSPPMRAVITRMCEVLMG